MTEKYSDYYNPVLSLSREKGVHPSAWFGGTGGVSGKRRRGCRSAGGVRFQGPRERMQLQVPGPWMAGASKVMSGLSNSKSKVILVTFNSGFLFLKSLCLSNKLHVCQSYSSFIQNLC